MLLALFDSTAGGLPNNLVASKVETVSGAVATRIMTLAAPVALTAGLYHLAFQCEVATIDAEIYFGSPAYFPMLAYYGLAAMNTGHYGAYQAARSWDGAAPASFPGGGFLQQARSANIGFRVA